MNARILTFVFATLALRCSARVQEGDSSARSASSAATSSPSSAAASTPDAVRCTSCGHPESTDTSTDSTPGSSSGSSPAAGARSFGAAQDDAVEVVALGALVANPDAYRDRTVRTSGTIVRVCQRMGCWMEMSAAEGPAVRVPMAGHAFFLPRDVAGREARVQGRVRVVELTAAMREHLASEGAQAVSSTLALEATGVVVD